VHMIQNAAIGPNNFHPLSQRKNRHREWFAGY
jgi:hypothetical protein